MIRAAINEGNAATTGTIQMRFSRCSLTVSVLFALMMWPSSPTDGQSNPTVAQTEEKAAYAILIDNTGSMRSQFDLVNQLSKRVVGQVHQLGPTSLYAFKTQGRESNAPAVVSSEFGWSRDKAILEHYIDSLFVIPGRTTLRDAVSAMAEQLNAKVAAANVPLTKNIVLITDGEDRVSRTGEKKLITALKENNIKVYAIGLISELDNQSGLIRGASRDRAVDFLEKVTKETGGRVVFLKSKKVDEEAFKGLFAK
jgi:hypothetical protein